MRAFSLMDQMDNNSSGGEFPIDLPPRSEMARFGHHPDPLDDFGVEIEVIEGMRADAFAGHGDPGEWKRRWATAMEFRVGTPEGVALKDRLRSLIV